MGEHACISQGRRTHDVSKILWKKSGSIASGMSSRTGCSGWGCIMQGHEAHFSRMSELCDKGS